MRDAIERCPHREALRGEHGRERAFCRLVERLTQFGDGEACAVQPETCEACLRSAPARDATANPVLASLVYAAAGKIIRAGGTPTVSVERAQRIQQRAVAHLGFVSARLPDRCFPPDIVVAAGQAGASGSPARSRTALSWRVGVTTAPRTVLTIRRTINSLRDAGFAELHVFAEPGSWIPQDADLRVTVHRRQLGSLTNMYAAFATLYAAKSDCDCYAVFQDDIEVATGLRGWCDREFWPLDAGLVSLFTPNLHSDRQQGWRILSPGFHRIYGGQALVFRRDALQRFLTDPQVLHQLQIRFRNSDAVVGDWAARRQIGIAYHTPSLVRHIGATSSIYQHGPHSHVVADAVASVDQLAAWSPPPHRPGKVGLVGWCMRTGIGHLNVDLAEHLAIHSWLSPSDLASPAPLWKNPGCRVKPAWRRTGPRELKSWLTGLDWVLFVERPCPAHLVRLARDIGVRVACVSNWEWTSPQWKWMRFVDLMICPTRRTRLHLSDWKRRYGFGWETAYVPWPVDTERFRFRQRAVCQRFVFINGWGGVRGRRLDGSQTEYHRKGIELIVAAARLAPRLPFLVYSLSTRLPSLPPNVELRRPPDANSDLYLQGDVCVQPSHWEGLGLQLLECQAAGMPLVTTDAPPMNEHEPLRTIRVADNEVVFLHDQPIVSQLMRAEDLVAVLQDLYGADIAEASLRARRYIERAHSWRAAQDILGQRLSVP